MASHCAVLGCFSVSNREKGVFLHRLPQKPALRDAWLAAVPTESKSKCFNVCSKHFKEEDFTFPADLAMIRRLNSDAVPSILPSQKMVEIMKLLKPIRNLNKKPSGKQKKPTFKPNTKKAVLDLISATCDSSGVSESDNDEDGDDVVMLSDDSFDDSDNETLNKIAGTRQKKPYVKVCRLCLDHQVKLFSVEKYGLKTLLQELLNIKMGARDASVSAVCAFCAALLVKVTRFRRRCLAANKRYQQLMSNGQQITFQKFKTVDRAKAGFNHPYTIQEIDSYYLGDDNTEDEYQDNNVDTKANENIILYTIPNSNDDATNFENVQLLEVGSELILNISKDNVVKKEMDIKPESFDIEESDQCGDFYNNVDENNDDEDNDDIGEEKPEELKETMVKTTRNQPAVKKSSIKRQAKKSPTYLPLDPNNWERVRFTEDKILETIRKRKESVLSKDAAYKCELCYRVFDGRETYDTHMYFHSPARGEYECKFCKFRFRKHCLRNRHLKQHYITYKCKRCSYQGMSTNNARLHDKFHLGVTYDCEACQKSFTKYTTYMGHVRRYHRSQHVCPGCGENFLSEQAVAVHFKRKHPEMEWPERDGSESEALYCAVCQIQFCNPPAYNTHFIMSTNHSDLGDSSQKKVSFYWQKRRSSKDAMKTKQKTPIKSDCPECGEQFASNIAYVRHHRAKHPGAPVARRYMCEICGNKYPSNTQLDCHRMLHTGMTPYSCDVCGKRFNLKSNLVRHTQSHTGVRRFGCGECGKRFTSKAGSEAHLRHVHQRVPWPRRQRTRHRLDAPSD